MNIRPAVLAFLAVAALAGCASPRVVLYPDERTRSVPPEIVQSDIDECEAKAKAFVKTNKGKLVARQTGGGAVFGALLGAVFGAFTGDYGRAVAEGASVGAAAGLAQGAASAATPDDLHRQFVEYCLRDKGYRPMGWK